jgi:hypothetical protein
MEGSMSTTTNPTERDRFWLDHEAKIAASGQTAKEYAAAHELSLHALYQSRKRLRSLGLFPAARRKTTKPKPAGFSRVRVGSNSSSPITAVGFRLRMPGGVTLEWSGEELPEAVVELVERLITLR